MPIETRRRARRGRIPALFFFRLRVRSSISGEMQLNL